jgi:hypothetical protein
MGIYTANAFHVSSGFREVCVINQQAANPVFMLTTHLFLVPYLQIDMIKELTPIDVGDSMNR